jgi:hypothetical protein
MKKFDLERLKEDDYIAWDHLVNDPMVVGQSTDVNSILPIVLILVIGIVVAMCV